MSRCLLLGFCAFFALTTDLCAQPEMIPWSDHYSEILPEGFDPWCAPVVGVEGDTAVTVARTTYADGKLLDIYYPAGVDLSVPATTVIFVNGNPDTQNIAQMGRPWMRVNQALGWSRLAAENGLIAIAYETGSHPVQSLEAMGRWILAHASEYGIDASRVGLWACSAGCNTAIGALQIDHDAFANIEPIFAVLYYGDLILRSTHNPSVPVLLVHAQQDDGVDGTRIERFVERLRERGAAVEFVTHATGRHAFDVGRDTPETRAVVDQTLAFMSKY